MATKPLTQTTGRRKEAVARARLRPGTGVHTINLLSALPTITDAVVIDATTDDSFGVNGSRPAIILDGNNAFTGKIVKVTVEQK